MTTLLQGNNRKGFIGFVLNHALPHTHFNNVPCQITYAKYGNKVVWDYEDYKKWQRST